jgi:hypothetical protein
LSTEDAPYQGARELHGGFLHVTWSVAPGHRVGGFVPVEAVWTGAVDRVGASVVELVRSAQGLPDDWTRVFD